MKTKPRFAIGILFCAALLPGCRNAAGTAPPIKPVQVQEVQNYAPGGQSDEGERYSASLLPAAQTELAFKNGGYLGSIHQVKGADGRLRPVQEGDRIPKGTELVRLRADDFEAKVKQAEAQIAEAQLTLDTNRAQLAEAEAGLHQAERDLARATSLVESRSLTKPEFEGAKTKVELAQARVDAIRSQAKVIQAKVGGAQALLSEARLAERDAILLAPVDCYILKRLVEPGSLVLPGRPVFVIADSASVKAVFGVPDTTVRTVKTGTPLTLTTEAIPGMNVRGWISRVSPAADPRSRVFDIEVTISRPPEQLRPGMIAAVTLPSGKSAAPVLVVPVNSIVRMKQAPQRYAVCVVLDQGGKQIARQRAVTLGEAFGNMIAIKEGVALGERVVVSGAAMVEEGETVRIIP